MHWAKQQPLHRSRRSWLNDSFIVHIHGWVSVSLPVLQCLSLLGCSSRSHQQPFPPILILSAIFVCSIETFYSRLLRCWIPSPSFFYFTITIFTLGCNITVVTDNPAFKKGIIFRQKSVERMNASLIVYTYSIAWRRLGLVLWCWICFPPPD